MNKDLEQKLVKNYPEFFSNYGDDPRKTCMAWGCECGDGWYNILDDMCYALSNFRWSMSQKLKGSDEYGSIYAPQIIFDQIKEKYGTLRVYYHSKSKNNIEDFEDEEKAREKEKYFYEQIQGIISAAEILSERTCEKCGDKNATQNKGGWITTLCENCRKL